MARELRRRYGHAGRMNREGMTLVEWSNAANAFGKVIEGAAARHEWQAGVDPTEYAPMASQGMKVTLERGRLVARKG